jgi:hypothetical protein
MRNQQINQVIIWSNNKKKYTSHLANNSNKVQIIEIPTNPQK